MSGGKIEYMVFGGTFMELSNGARRFGGSPYGDTFDCFEDAYVFYSGIDLEDEYGLMSKSELFDGYSVYKRLDRVKWNDEDPTEVDVITFECFDGVDFSHD